MISIFLSLDGGGVGWGVRDIFSIILLFKRNLNHYALDQRMIITLIVFNSFYCAHCAVISILTYT